MLKKLIPQVLLLLSYEILVVLSLIAAVRWLTIQEASPLVRALVFLGGMALFVPPLLAATLSPYHAPSWLATVQSQGKPASAEVVANEYIGDYWRSQDMPRFITLPVQVRAEEGKPFSALLTCQLGQAQSLPPGTTLAVRYNPQHPERVAIANKD